MDLLLWIVISLVIILILHNLFYFFKDTLTNPITKDLIKRPNETYIEVENILKNKNEKKEIEENMKDELKSFFKDLKDNKNNNENKLDSFSQNETLSFTNI